MKLWEIRTIHKESNPGGIFIVSADNIAAALHAVLTFGDASQYIDPLSGHWGINTATGEPRTGTGVIASNEIPEFHGADVVYCAAVADTVTAETIAYAEGLID